jgi:hypothetical protein
MTTTTTLGEGVLNWSRYERIGDRYGAIHLASQPWGEDYVTWESAPAGQKGTLVARIIETRPSGHAGDWARGIGPSIPKPGDEIELGVGTLFAEVSDYGTPTIGVKPGDGRAADWMDPRALYRCHNQTVRLEFRPEVTP